MKITEKKFTIQSPFYWHESKSESDDPEYFNTIEEAVESFRTKSLEDREGVIVCKVAVVRDKTLKMRDVEVEVL